MKPFHSWSTRQPQRSASRGVSLIELLAVMSVNAVLIGAAVVLLVAIGRADRGYDKRLSQQHAVAQLNERLRADIHAADQMTWDEPKKTLRLTAADGSVLEYVAEKERWVRRAFSPKDESEGELTGAYPVPAGLQTKLEPMEATPGQRVRIEWTLPAGEVAAATGPSSITEMIAVVGRDERLLHE